MHEHGGLADRSRLVERTNRWLRRLGLGGQVLVQSLLDCGAGPSARRLRFETGTGSLVLPSEAGAGVSQLLPILVAAAQARAGLSLLEQPELHVSPAVQAGLGDLLIEAATRDEGRRTMLVATHSEPLIARVLRRIGSTSEGELPARAPGLRADLLSILQVERHPDGMRIRRLRVDEARASLRSTTPPALGPELDPSTRCSAPHAVTTPSGVADASEERPRMAVECGRWRGGAEAEGW